MLTVRNTSAYPDDEIKHLLRFAGKDVDTRNVCVNVKGGRAFGGRAYNGVPRISNAPRSAKYLVTLKLGNPETLAEYLPWVTCYKKRAEVITWHTWQDILVHIGAHEFKHIEQYREGLKRSELRCEAFAIHTLKQYREQAA